MSNPFLSKSRSGNQQKPSESILDRVISGKINNPSQQDSIGKINPQVQTNSKQIISKENNPSSQKSAKNQFKSLQSPNISTSETKDSKDKAIQKWQRTAQNLKQQVKIQNNIFKQNDETANQSQDPKGNVIVTAYTQMREKAGQIRLEYPLLLKYKTSEMETGPWKVYEDFQKKCQSLWKETIKNNNYYRFFFHLSNFHILGFLQKDKNPIPEDLICRLKQGFRFYTFQPDRNEAFSKIIKQNIIRKQNANPLKNLENMITKYQIDSALAFYFCYHEESPSLSKEQYTKFIEKQELNLLKIYQVLSENGRLSNRRLILKGQQLAIIKNTLEYFANQCKNKSSKSVSQILVQIVTLLKQTLIHDKKEISRDQIISYFLQPISNLFSIISQSFVESFVIELFLTWDLFDKRTFHIQLFKRLGKLQSFAKYYVFDQPLTRRQLCEIMSHLYSFNWPEEVRSEYHIKKCQVAIQVYEKIKSQKKLERQKIELIGLQSVFLIHMTIKLKIKGVLFDRLCEVLFFACPCAVFIFLEDLSSIPSLILPYIAKKYQKNQRTAFSCYIQFREFNKMLPKEYSNEFSSENFLICKFLLALIVKYASSYLKPGHFQTLKEIQETLEKLNLTTLTFSDQHSLLEIVRLTSKYMHHYINHDIGFNTTNVGQQIQVILQLLYKAIESLKGYSNNIKQFSRNLQCLSSLIFMVAGSNNLLDQPQKQSQLQLLRNYKKVMVFVEKMWRQRLIYQNKQTIQKYSEELPIQIQACLTIYKNCFEVASLKKRSSSCKDSKHNTRNYYQKLLIYMQTFCLLLRIVGNENAERKQIVILRLDKQFQGFSITEIMQSLISAVKIENKAGIIIYNSNTTDHKLLEQILQMFFIQLNEVMEVFATNQAHPRDKKQIRVKSYPQQLIQIIISNSPILLGLSLIFLSNIETRDKDMKKKLAEIKLMQKIIDLWHRKNATNQTRNNRQAVGNGNGKVIKLMLLSLSIEYTQKMQAQLFKALFSHQSSTLLYQTHILLCEIAIKYQQTLLDKLQSPEYFHPLIQSITCFLTIQKQATSQFQFETIKSALNIFYFFFSTGKLKIDNKISSTISTIVQKILPYSFDLGEVVSLVWMLVPHLLTQPKKSIIEITLSKVGHFLRMKEQQEYQQQGDKAQLETSKLLQITIVYLHENEKTSRLFRGSISQIQTCFLNLIEIILFIYRSLSGNPGIEAQKLKSHLNLLDGCTLKICQSIKFFRLKFGIVGPQIQRKIKILSSLIQKFKEVSPFMSAEIANLSKSKFLENCISLLNEQETDLKNRYFSEKLIQIEMKNQKSFFELISGLSQQISEQAKQKNTIERFRTYYLFYYLLHKISNEPSKKFYPFLFDYQTHSKPDIKLRINQIFSQNIDYLTETFHEADLVQSSWQIISINKMVEIYPQAIRADCNLKKILIFSVRYLNFLLVRLKGRHHQCLQEWLSLIQILKIVIFCFRTHQHSIQDYQKLFQQARSNYYAIMVQKYLSWSQQKEKKISQKRLQSALFSNRRVEGKEEHQQIETVMNDKFQRAKKPINLQQNNEKVNEEWPDKMEQRSYGFCLRLQMKLIEVHYYLNLLLFDLKLSLKADPFFKDQYAAMAQQLLVQFQNFYFEYFQKGSKSQYFSLDQINEQNLQFYIHSKQRLVNSSKITFQLSYLNKKLGQYLSPTHPHFDQNPSNEQNCGSLLNSDLRILNLVILYNKIEDCLSAFGYNCSYKFRIKSKAINASLLKSRRSQKWKRL